MSIVLRDYQRDCVDSTRDALRSNRNVLLQAPTGAGKTAMASYILGNVAARGKRGFFICHRQELVEQTAKTFDKVGIRYGYIASGFKPNYYQPVQICSIDTLKNRLHSIPNPDLCVWDEAHHLRARGWVNVHNHFSSAYHVGLSATPQRLDGKGLDDRFDHLVPGPSVAWLIDQGYLAKYKLYSVPGMNRDQLHTRMGKFITSEVEAEMDKPAITGNIVAHWKKYASDKLTIGFAASRKMSEKYVAEFNAAGIPTIHLDGETPKAERKQKLRDFALGKYRVVWNVGLFGEGFDIAANSGMDVTVGCIIDAAPSKSLSAWLQRCGRALRPQDGHAIILDHSGNIQHGLPCQPREWTLEGRDATEREQSDDEAISIRQCLECYAVHKPSPTCPECGHVYQVQHRQIKEIAGELMEVDKEKIRKQARLEQGGAKTLEELKELADQRGLNPGWAAHVARAREEKKRLQEKLINLTIGAKSMGIDTRMTKGDIYKLKPKALRDNIAVLDAQLNKTKGGYHEKNHYTEKPGM